MTESLFYTKKNNLTENYGQFVIEPLNQSFAHSLGNALRRTLLSSLQGAAVTAVKIKGAPHLFTTMRGVKESAIEIVLNLKQLRFELPREGKYKMYLSAKGLKKIYGKDFEGEIRIINKNLYLAELTEEKAKLEIEVVVETGQGYVMADEQSEKEFGFVNVDSAFSPVKKVNFKVEETRVGRKSNYERLTIDIWTDGGMSPELALRQSTQKLAGYFERILSGEDVFQDKKETSAEERQKEMDKKFYDLIIDELNLPSRVVNALLRQSIETVADLIKTGKEQLVGMKGLGKKSLELIQEELGKLGVELK